MAIRDLITAHTVIRYGYGKVPLITAYVNVGYAYRSQYYQEITSPQIGFKAPATQSIANNLPPWMAMRQSNTSNGWQLMNSWGMALEDCTDLVTKHLRNLFLATTDRHMRFRVFRGDLLKKEIFEFTPSRNLLFNTSFSMADAARTRLPEGWTDHFKPYNQTVVRTTDTQMVGTGCIKVEGGGTFSQLQTVDGRGTVGSITASIYVYSESAVDAVLVLSVQDMSGYVYSTQKVYNSSPSTWERIVATVDVSSEIYEVQVTVRCNSTAVAYFDAAQLEVGTKATDWQAGDGDKLAYIGSPQNIRLVESQSLSKRRTLYPIGNTTEFSDILIPTRIESQVPPSVDLEPFSTSILGRSIDLFDNIIPTSWLVRDGQLVQCDANLSYDVLGRYSIRDLRRFQGGDYGTYSDVAVVITPLATAVREDLLFVVCKEVYRGRTIRTLKVIRAKVPPSTQTYVESVRDFELDLDFSTIYGYDSLTEEVSSIGFSEKDPTWMVVNGTLGSRFYFRLYYDYCFLNYNTRTIYTLEPYYGAQLQVT